MTGRAEPNIANEAHEVRLGIAQAGALAAWLWAALSAMPWPLPPSDVKELAARASQLADTLDELADDAAAWTSAHPKSVALRTWACVAEGRVAAEGVRPDIADLTDFMIGAVEQLNAWLAGCDGWTFEPTLAGIIDRIQTTPREESDDALLGVVPPLSARLTAQLPRPLGRRRRGCNGSGSGGP